MCTHTHTHAASFNTHILTGRIPPNALALSHEWNTDISSANDFSPTLLLFTTSAHLTN